MRHKRNLTIISNGDSNDKQFDGKRPRRGPCIRIEGISTQLKLKKLEINEIHNKITDPDNDFGRSNAKNRIRNKRNQNQNSLLGSDLKLAEDSIIGTTQHLDIAE